MNERTQDRIAVIGVTLLVCALVSAAATAVHTRYFVAYDVVCSANGSDIMILEDVKNVEFRENVLTAESSIDYIYYVPTGVICTTEEI